MWLEASTFIKVHGIHSLTKRVSASFGKTTNHDKYAVNNRLYQHPKEDAHIKRDIENNLIFRNI